jgi:hypothetical protein
MGSLHRRTGGIAAMMGTKIRSFALLPRDVSLEDLVPRGNFYRRLEKRLDLGFVRQLVRPLYDKGGRPSVDPVVFFKLQLARHPQSLLCFVHQEIGPAGLLDHRPVPLA